MERHRRSDRYKKAEKKPAQKPQSNGRAWRTIVSLAIASAGSKPLASIFVPESLYSYYETTKYAQHSFIATIVSFLLIFFLVLGILSLLRKLFKG